MKKAGLVVTKKRFMTKNKDMVAPLSLSPINFSLNYYYTFHSKIPFEVVQVIKIQVTKTRLDKIFSQFLLLCSKHLHFCDILFFYVIA